MEKSFLDVLDVNKDGVVDHKDLDALLEKVFFLKSRIMDDDDGFIG